jgi:hypothetical protein
MEQFLRQLAASGRIATALGEAARFGHAEHVHELLQTGADPNARDDAGNTPLMLAASGGNVKAIRLLIDAGGEVNSQGNQDGRTPLMSLVAALHPLRVYLSGSRVLLDAGADPNIRANNGTTVMDWAMQGRPDNLIEFLRQAGAEPGNPSGFHTAINLDNFRMVLRGKGSGYIAASGFGEIELPAPEQLKQAAIDWLSEEAADPSDEQAATLLRTCDLSYVVAHGKDVMESLIEVVIAAPQQAHEVIQDERNPITKNILSALLEICPDIGSNRLEQKV